MEQEIFTRKEAIMSALLWGIVAYLAILFILPPVNWSISESLDINLFLSPVVVAVPVALLLSLAFLSDVRKERKEREERSLS